MKIISIIGTRPEAIKMAPVVQLLYSQIRSHQLLITAQHRGMLDQTLRIFNLTPDHDLDLMQRNQSIVDLTCRVLTGVSEVLRGERPDLVLVHGDTTTTMAASLAAFYQQIPIGHVEAGLRTRDKYSPFPEELNRRITDCLADLYFAPTELNRKLLLAENVAPEQIVVTGNTAIDALFFMKSKLAATTVTVDELSFNPKDKDYLLVTAHRRESFGEGILRICRALKEISTRYPDLQIVYPVHKNPNIHTVVHRELGACENVQLLNPLDYDQFCHLMIHSRLILTDSGGIQEEAPSLGIPVLVLRDKTERQEAVTAGTVKLVGTDVDAIVTETIRLLGEPEVYTRMSVARNPYGDGKASQRILTAIQAHFRDKRLRA